MKQTLRLRGELCPKTKPNTKILYTIFITFTIVLVSCVCTRAQVSASSQEAGPAAEAVKQPIVTQHLNGVVLSAADGRILEGATVKLKDTDKSMLTNDKGEFSLKTNRREGVFEVSFVGYKTQKITFTNNQTLTVSLEPDEGLLEEVLVNTGYQEIAKERATGSFVQIDNRLLNRRVGPNIMDRLEGITSGLIFNKNKTGNTPDISIRGRSTIQGNPDPLIVLDNFPYDGRLENINPQDVESITILKDAAAASIWGVRAGNGVIVITTKKGNRNQKPVINFNTNLNIGEKPNVYYMPQLNNKEYIAVEKFLFEKGKFNSTINNDYKALSPAVEFLLMHRNGIIDQARQDEMLDSIALYDNRKELDKYYYRKSIGQQYQLNINGGGQYNKYYFSLGYDKSLSSLVIQNNDRLTLNANNTVFLFSNKLDLTTGVTLTLSNDNTDAIGYTPRYPYERIADDAGNPLPVTDGTLRLSYVDTVGQGKLLDWHYKPLDELINEYSKTISKLTDYRLNTTLSYHVFEGINIRGDYTFQKGANESSVVNDFDSYTTRNLINRFTQIDGANGMLSYPVPLGDYITNSLSTYYSHYGRIQLDYNRVFSEKHVLTGIAGFEIKDYRNERSGYALYGYDGNTGANYNSSMNFGDDYKTYYNNSLSKISPATNNSWIVDRFRSIYANLSYSYNNKYVISGSARKDESNLFGVKSNQKGVPLWSAGLYWNISNEKFYRMQFVPYLKLRFTYGYNGNVDKTTSAYLTARPFISPNLWNVNYYEIQNPPNPSLRWEKVRNVNIGLDFGTINNRISGSIQYWIKNGEDLIGRSPIAQQTGISVFVGNSADMRTDGLDLILSSKIIELKGFNWSSSLLFNYNTDKITSYKGVQSSNRDIIRSNYQNPLEGYSYYSLFSYKWLGLDTVGAPQTVLNGERSKDYSAVRNSLNRNDLIYNGTITPRFFGGFRNTFSYKSFELSVNLMFKFDYVFRRNSLSNVSLYSTYPLYRQDGYGDRWQEPGDEQFTDVPALIYPANVSRDEIYAGSEILIENGDHIRLQDVKLAYRMNRNAFEKLPFNAINFYLYANNLGVIWKASDKKFDPDGPKSIPAPKILSFGISVDF